jgi:2-methylfumaryl-CoA isomerase
MTKVPVGELSGEDGSVALEAASHRVTVVPTVEELTEDPELQGYDTFGTVEQPGLGALMALGLPIQWSEQLVTSRVGPAPALGADTRDVLTEVCRLSDSEVALLDAEGVLV